MSTQISKSKLDVIRRKLIQNKFKEKINIISSKLGEILFNDAVEQLPKDLNKLYLSIPEQSRNVYFQHTSNCYISRYQEDFIKYLNSKINNEDFKKLMSNRKYFSDSITIDFPGVLPMASYTITMLKQSLDSKELTRILFGELIKLVESRYELNKRLECLFSSKRFYPNTLKNEFPEAYQIYLTEEFGHDISKSANSCDSVETVRAILNSSK